MLRCKTAAAKRLKDAVPHRANLTTPIWGGPTVALDPVLRPSVLRYEQITTFAPRFWLRSAAKRPTPREEMGKANACDCVHLTHRYHRIVRLHDVEEEPPGVVAILASAGQVHPHTEAAIAGAAVRCEPVLDLVRGQLIQATDDHVGEPYRQSSTQSPGRLAREREVPRDTEL
jgi:hypothetical protein